MSAPQRLGISYRRATAVSIALHLLAIVACLRMWAAPLPDAGLRERATSEDVRVSQITIESRMQRATVAARVAKPKPALPVAPRVHVATAKTQVAAATAPLPHEAPVQKHASVPRPSYRTAAADVIVDATAQPQSPAAAAVASEATAPPAHAESTATPAPVVLADVKAPEVSAEVSSGGWGQSFAKPIVADDDALASLRASIHEADVSADIAVDDTGHATHVTLPASLPDDERAEIEQRLLSLRYVPAECNGLRCAATLRIAL